MNIALRNIIKRATLATVALLLSFGIAGAQMDLRISKSKIKSSLKRLDQLELLAAQLNTASGSTQAAAAPAATTATAATAQEATTTAAASTQAAAAQLCQIAKQCIELSERISHYINQVNVLGTLQASSEKVLQRTLLLTKLDSLSKELASHKESISSIGSSIMSLSASSGTSTGTSTGTSSSAGNGASSKALKSIGANILKVAEKEYLYQAMAVGNMISALGAMK